MPHYICKVVVAVFICIEIRAPPPAARGLVMPAGPAPPRRADLNALDAGAQLERRRDEQRLRPEAARHGGAAPLALSC
jgi:hypothetical protein